MILWGLGCENMALEAWVVNAMLHYFVSENLQSIICLRSKNNELMSCVCNNWNTLIIAKDL